MTKKLTTEEKSNLLRYFIGTPPYVEDAYARHLADRFLATDERTPHGDSRLSPEGLDYVADQTKARDEVSPGKADK